MQTMRDLARGGAAALIAIPIMALAGSSDLAALGSLQTGMWELRERGEPGQQSICITDAERFIQLRHVGLKCSRQVVENQPTRATVQYSCTGAGYGRTTVNQITPRSVHIETQGVEAGVPFHFELDARRTGPCAMSARK